MKKSAEVLHCFVLYCEGLLDFFKYSTYEPSSKRKMYSSRIFWKRLRFLNKQPACGKVGCLDGFLYEAQNFELFIKNVKFKNQKPIAVYVFF
jgi:hypothetical protein